MDCVLTSSEVDLGLQHSLDYVYYRDKGNTKITELRTILQRESQNS